MVYLFDLHFYRALPIGEVCAFYNECIGHGVGKVLLEIGGIKLTDKLHERTLARVLRRMGIHKFL